MPTSVRFSLWMLLIGLAVSLASIPFDPGPWPTMPSTAVFITAMLLGAAIFGLLAFVYVRTYQARNWARWVLLTFTVVAVLGSLRDAGAHFMGPTLIGTVHTAMFCLNVISVALLFTRTSNAWYRDAAHKSPAS